MTTLTGEPASQLFKILRCKAEYLRISLASGISSWASPSDLSQPQDKSFLIIPPVLQFGTRLKSSKAVNGCEKLLELWWVKAIAKDFLRHISTIAGINRRRIRMEYLAVILVLYVVTMEREIWKKATEYQLRFGAETKIIITCNCTVFKLQKLSDGCRKLKSGLAGVVDSIVAI